MAEQSLDITWKTIAKVFVAIFVFYMAYLIKDVALWFFFALVISVLLAPAINFLRWFKIPKIIAIILVYFFIFGFLGFLIYLIAPVFIVELRLFSQQIPDYFEKINPFLRQWGVDVAYSFNDLTQILVNRVEQGSKGVINAISTFFGGIASAIFILTLAFFLSLEEKGVEKFLIILTPKKYEEQIVNTFQRAQKKVSSWFGARILACLFVGIASFIIFFIFDIKYAFLLALIAGILNFIPYIGPWITAFLLLAFVSVSDSWIIAIYIFIIFTIIQTIEGNVLTPILMKKMINLPPALVLIALLIGSQMFGFLGVVFAVPVFGIVYEFLKEFLEKKRTEAIEFDQ
jgi:predicted PurR-regulated permease PerM